MNRAPSFQFFPRDWLSSSKIALMTAAEEGAYIRLLAYAWTDPDCSLPDDDETLAQLSRLGEAWLKGSSSRLRACFVPHPKKDGRLVNLRLLKERERQAEWREKCRLGGIQSGKTRTSSMKGSSRVVEVKANRLVEVKGNSSSSSSLKRDRERKKGTVTLNGHLSRFDLFWAAYPKKEGKGACERWWRSHRPDDVLFGQMLAKIEQAKSTEKWREANGRFIPMPATWLNQKRWEDDYTVAVKQKERIPL